MEALGALVKEDFAARKLSAPADAPAARARVLAFLARDDVRRQLEAFGVDPEDASQRVARLTDDEVAQIDGKIDALPAGGDTLVAVLTLIVVVFLILIILDAVGVTDLFPWVNKPHHR